MRKLVGSYSVVIMIDGVLYGFRDPLGIKPFCIGKTESGYMVASESVAVDALSAKFLRDVKPGELIRIDAEGVRCMQIAVAGKRAHCIFEYIYFARADAVIDGVLVYDVRRQIGQKLFEEDPVKADSVCSVPDSGTAYAIGYAERSKIPFVESLMKNRYMGRTFIMPSQREREKAVRIKLNPIPAHLKGKSVVLVDDGIVRGTTSKRIIEMMRDAGAREVHMRIGSPAIKAPCYLGVDMPTREELIASNKSRRRSVTASLQQPSTICRSRRWSRRSGSIARASARGASPAATRCPLRGKRPRPARSTSLTVRSVRLGVVRGISAAGSGTDPAIFLVIRDLPVSRCSRALF